MTKYKKEAPKESNDNCKTIEDYLARIIFVMENELDQKTAKGWALTNAITILVRKAWNLVPENGVIVELIKSCNFCRNKMPDIEYYMPGSIKRYCSTECLKKDKKK